MRSAARGSPCDEAEIGVHHADQRQAGKIVALGDELRADDDVHLAARDRLELRRGCRCMPPSMSLDRTSVRAVGKRSSTSSCSRSTPGPQATRRLLRAAIRAGVRPPLLVAAMMAGEDAAEAVVDQPGRAVRAGHAVAAGAAERQRRIAAAVEEKQRLLAASNRLGDRRDERRRQPAAALRRVCSAGRWRRSPAAMASP